MITIKFDITTFHKRVLNLNILRLFYFLKKEYGISFTNLIIKKTNFKLFNILKSPVRYKIARNQMSLIKYKASGYVSFKPRDRGESAYKSILFGVNHLLLNFKSSSLNSNSVWRVTKILRV